MTQIHLHSGISSQLVGEIIALYHLIIQVEVEFCAITDNTEVQTAGVAALHFLSSDHIIVDHCLISNEIGGLPAQQRAASVLDSVGAAVVYYAKSNSLTIVKNELQIGSGSGFGFICVISCHQGYIHICVCALELQRVAGATAAGRQGDNALTLLCNIPYCGIKSIFKNRCTESKCYIVCLCACSEGVSTHTCSVNIHAAGLIVITHQHLRTYQSLNGRSGRQNDLLANEMGIAELGDSAVIHIAVHIACMGCTVFICSHRNLNGIHICLDAEGNLYTGFSQVIIVTQVDEHLGIGSDAAFRITGSIGTLGQVADRHLTVFDEQIHGCAVADHTQIQAILIAGSDLIGIN